MIREIISLILIIVVLAFVASYYDEYLRQRCEEAGGAMLGNQCIHTEELHLIEDY